jgi:hypothetical protein
MRERPSLFRLPRELRDEIYKYALYHTEGLLYTIGSNGLGVLRNRANNIPRRSGLLGRLHGRLEQMKKARGKHRSRDYNQLKHVCRQLREESTALCPHGNSIITEDSPRMNAFEICLLLIQQFPRLRSVAVRCCVAAFKNECRQSELLRAVQQHASRTGILVRVHVPYWSLADADFVFRGLFYLYTFRNNSRLIERLAQVSSVTYLSDCASEMLITDRPIPENMRFCPWEDEFDVRLFEEGCRKQPVLALPPAQAALGNAISLARGWIEHGI